MIVTGLSFLARLLGLTLSIVAILVVLLIFIIVINRVLRYVLDMFGVEMFDLWTWLKKKFPRKAKA